jgi:HSP20 family protein
VTGITAHKFLEHVNLFCDIAANCGGNQQHIVLIELIEKGDTTMSNIIRRDPFFALTSLQDRVNQLFSQTFGGFEGPGLEQPLTSANFLPPVDIFEDEHNITLQAEIPGVKEEDLNVTLENNVLTITGERKFKEEEKKDNFHRIERRYGKFTRSFTLPASVDPQNVNATFENGVLNMTLPKREEFKPKKITIGVSKSPAASVKPGKEKAA